MERVPTYIKPKPIFYCIFDFTKGKVFQFYFQAEIIYGVVRDRIEKPRHPAANVIIPVVLHQRKK